MARNMSFMLTPRQLLYGDPSWKDVTRRLGWWFLQPGDQLMACEKCQGLGKGGKLNRYGLIDIVSNRAEPLNSITEADCIREGFPEFSPQQFVEFFCDTHRGCQPSTIVNRIEFINPFRNATGLKGSE